MFLALRELLLDADPLRRADLPSFELSATQTAGEFTGGFDDTPIAGVYQFVTTVTGLGPDCQPFQRESTGAAAVTDEVVAPRVRVDVNGGAGGTVDVVVTPGGSGGTRAGPGLASRISIQAVGLIAAGVLRDNLDGSYVQTFTVPTPGGLATLSIQALGVALPPINVETRLPRPASINLNGARNDVIQPVTIAAGTTGDISRVAGVRLVSDSRVIRLTGVQVNPSSRTVQVTIPAGLEPDLYALYFEAAGVGGQGPTTAGATFRAVGRGQHFPTPVLELAQDVTRLLQAPTPAQGIIALSQFLDDLRVLSSGPNLTAAARQAAVTEAVQLIVQDRSQPARFDIPAILAAVNLARIDARYIPIGPVPTPVGTGVDLALGNGVSVSFSQVTGAGQTTSVLRDGPAEISELRRGTPHATYDLSTTAAYSTPGIQVSIEYEDEDFPKEPVLRIFHWEANQWVDRTQSLDTLENRIRAQATSTLGQFVLVSGTGSIFSPTVSVNRSMDQADPTTLSPIRFEVLFSEPVIDFVAGDVRLTGTALPSGVWVESFGDGLRFAISVFGMTHTGTVVASIPAGVAHDAAGNTNEASTSSDNQVAYQPWHNLVSPLDDSGDGVVSPLDALMIINYINLQLGDPSLPQVTPPEVLPGSPPPQFGAAPPLVDVNGDDLCTPQDVIEVINHLNASASGKAPLADAGPGVWNVRLSTFISVRGGFWPSLPAGGEGERVLSDILIVANHAESPPIAPVRRRGLRRFTSSSVEDPLRHSPRGESAADESSDPDLFGAGLDDVLSAVAEDVAKSWN